MTMKRNREDEQVETAAMANCLMLLSRVGKTSPSLSGRTFECKTCNKQFPSFQALGGHRASHRKPRSTAGDFLTFQLESPQKPKTHECSICGLEFAIGQALGGHMRRHRVAVKEGSLKLSTAKLMEGVPFLKKSSSKRVLCLDLNLMPYENDFKLFI